MIAALLLAAAARTLPADPAKLAREYASAVEKLNEAHARKPEARTEEELAARLPQAASKAVDDLLAIEKAEDLAEALAEAGKAALDLARTEDFERIRRRLAEVEPGKARELGIALARPRFLLRGLNDVEPEGLEAFAGVLDLVLDAYGDLFGITSFSKVPGKKLRVRVHLEERIEKPPHFAPQFPWHSEIDFPVIDAKALRSPTPDGKFLFYGLCHELGHVVAMWGDASREEDHHAWAHYTGVAIVEHLSETKGDAPALADLKDLQWRSLGKEREAVAKAKTKPSLSDKEGVMALLVGLHDAVGPKAIGEAVEAMSAKGEGTRVNRVRYYRFDDLEKALLATAAGKKHKKEIAALFR